MTPFSLILNLFDCSFSQILKSDWVLFFSHAEPGYRKFDEVHPPRGYVSVGAGTHILEHGGDFHSINVRFFYIFRPLWVPFYAQLDLIDPSFCRKNQFVSHLVPEIIWAKIGLIFNKHLLFDHFETFCTNFPWFSILLTSFYSF